LVFPSANIENERIYTPLWCKWIDQTVRGGSMGIKVNEDIGHYFHTKKGLRQGNSLSPLLFNLVANMLARQGNSLSPLLFNLVANMLAVLIERAKVNGDIRRSFHI
jgi:hypothetical protein